MFGKDELILRLKVKICGLMRGEDIEMCARYGTDILGLVVDYPHVVPWNLTLEAANELISLIPDISVLSETCVVTGGSTDKILRIISKIKPNYVQLHCGENLKDTAYIVSELKPYGIKVIKTIFPNVPNLKERAIDFCDTGVYALLFDPRTPDNALVGGMADISAFIELQNTVNCPVILAGGITPENAAAIIRSTDAQIIDLMTGVEQRPGVKDEEKVKSLFKALRSVRD